MANPPGVVTDPSRIKGGVISLQSGGGQIAAYLANPKPARQLSRHRRDPGGLRAGRPHLRPGAALRQYRLQCGRAGALLAARRPDQPVGHQHGLPGHVRAARQRGGAGPRSGGRLSARAARGHRQGRRDRLLLGRPAHAAVRLQQPKGRCRDRLLGRFYPSRHAGCRDDPGPAEGAARHGGPAQLPAVRRVRRRGPEPAGGARSRTEKARRKRPARTSRPRSTRAPATPSSPTTVRAIARAPPSSCGATSWCISTSICGHSQTRFSGIAREGLSGPTSRQTGQTCGVTIPSSDASASATGLAN